MNIGKSQLSKRGFLTAGILVAAGGLGYSLFRSSPLEAKTNYSVSFSDAEWKKRLSPAAYNILRQEATERPYSSALNKEHRRGTFICAGCSKRLFSSADKFNSGTGWPSFTRALPGAVGTSTDNKIGFPRTEVHCARCGGHLGHVFNDGPKPTGKRWCINGAAMKFRPA